MGMYFGYVPVPKSVHNRHLALDILLQFFVPDPGLVELLKRELSATNSMLEDSDDPEMPLATKPHLLEMGEAFLGAAGLDEWGHEKQTGLDAV
jgi:hypothetical protein